MNPTNQDRAEWAAAALRHFQCTTGTDYDDALTDLLGDLMHFADRENLDFEAALAMARAHYEAEKAEAAAPNLLSAAEKVIAAWDRGDLAGAVRELSAAIDEAKGGEQ